MAKENLFGAIKVPTTETSTKTISMETGNTYGLMAESTTDNGLTIRWKAKVLLPGVTVDDMLGNIKTTRNMGKEHLNGLMAENISENGTKENNMVEVFT